MNPSNVCELMSRGRTAFGTCLHFTDPALRPPGLAKPELKLLNSERAVAER